MATRYKIATQDRAETLSNKTINEAKGSDIASATTTDIGAATGNYVNVTGTTTITGLGTVQAGTRRIVNFTGALTLTHNATSLILPTAANITTAAGDTAVFVSLGSGNWKCVSYDRASGAALAAGGGADVGLVVGTEQDTTVAEWETLFQPWGIYTTKGTTCTGFQLNSASDHTGGSSTLYNGTGNSYFSVSHQLFKNNTGNTYVRFADISAMRLQGSFLGSTTGTGFYSGFGLSIDSGSGRGVSNVHTTTSVPRACFTFDKTNSKVYTVTCSGSAVTNNDVTASITAGGLTSTQKTLIIYDGTDVKFYFNGTLVATHTTNLPFASTSTCAIAHEAFSTASAGNAQFYSYPTTISLKHV